MIKLLRIYASYWKKFAVFKGRTRRRDLWLIYLMNTIITFLICLLLYLSNTMLDIETRQTAIVVIMSFYILIIVLSIVPSLSLIVRRLHDVGIPGSALSWIFLPNKAMLGHRLRNSGMSNSSQSTLFLQLSRIDILLYVLVISHFYTGVSGANEYGPDPKKV